MWVNGFKEGYGVYEWKNGDKYEGFWQDNQPHGKGIKKWANGESYIGEWDMNEPTGEGVYKMADGTIEEGIWTRQWINGDLVCFEVEQQNVISYTKDLNPKTEPKRLETELKIDANSSKAFLVDQLTA